MTSKRETRDLARAIDPGLLVQYVLGEITAVDLTNRKVDVDFEGGSAADIPILDSVRPAVGVGLWMAKLGKGRLLGVDTVGVTAGGPYTPNLASITLGTGGTNTATYHFDGTHLDLFGAIELGTGPTIGTSPRVGLPSGFVWRDVSDDIQTWGMVRMIDANGPDVYGGCVRSSPTGIEFVYYRTFTAPDGTAALSTSIAGANNPITWTSNDGFRWACRIPAERS
jgi:hypothetical protein